MEDKVGFIGAGNMGSALIKGLIESKTLKPENINAFDVIEEQTTRLKKEFGINKCSGIEELSGKSDIIILAVKPQNMMEVLETLKPSLKKNQLVVSIAAGISISFIQNVLGDSVPIVRVMPNTPALVLQSASALARNSQVTDELMQKALELFSAVGFACEVEEKLMDAVTGLSGSGPAYVLLFLEALTDAGVLVGLPRNLARELVIQTAIGTLTMIKQNDAHFAQLKDMVTSPGGTTIHGLEVMEKNGFRGMIMEAIKAATTRSMELQAKK